MQRKTSVQLMMLTAIILASLTVPLTVHAQGGDGGDSYPLEQLKKMVEQAAPGAQGGPTVIVEGASFAPRDTITVRYSGITNPAAQDWIGMYAETSPNEKYGEYYYLKASSSGTLTFRAPTAPGSYQMRMFLNWPSGRYRDVARSAVFAVAPAAAERPVQPVRTDDWTAVIKSGRQFRVAFDVAPQKFSDAGWAGDMDPMGTLKGGEVYTVTYSIRSGWSVEGFNEGTGGRGTWNYQGISPDNHQLNLWGRVYSFSRNGEVFDHDFGLVGHLR